MKVFIDTGAWAALENQKDENHDAAILFRDEIASRHCHLFTSNFILDETFTLLLANVGLKPTIRFKERINLLQDNRLLEVVHVTDMIEDRAWQIFERFNKDKFWSFTDCTSKVIMDILMIKEVFGFDRDFEQMGFIRKP